MKQQFFRAFIETLGSRRLLSSTLDGGLLVVTGKGGADALGVGTKGD